MKKRKGEKPRELDSGRYQSRYRDHEGTRRSGGTFAKEMEAIARTRAILVDLDRGDYFDPQKGQETLATYADIYVRTHRVTKTNELLTEGTKHQYCWQLDKHVLPVLGAVELRHLTRSKVKAWNKALAGPGGPGASTAAKCYRTLHAICAAAVDDELIRVNPCGIRGAGIEPYEERIGPTQPQVEALADAVDERYRAMVLLAAYCGLRIGQLGALKQRHLDPMHGTVTVAASARQIPGQGRVVGKPKSRASRRTVAIPPPLLGIIEDHLARYAEPGPDGLVFVGPKGAALNASNFTDGAWKKARQVVGMPDLHFHDLRHSACQFGAATRPTEVQLMAWMGQSSPTMVRRYQWPTVEGGAEMARRMGENITMARVTELPRTNNRVT